MEGFKKIKLVIKPEFVCQLLFHSNIPNILSLSPKFHS